MDVWFEMISVVKLKVGDTIEAYAGVYKKIERWQIDMVARKVLVTYEDKSQWSFCVTKVVPIQRTEL